MKNATTTCESYSTHLVGGDFSTTSTCQTTYGSTTSTDPSVAGGFTYGEVVNGLFLFLIFVAVSMIAFRLYFQRSKVKAKIE